MPAEEGRARRGGGLLRLAADRGGAGADPAIGAAGTALIEGAPDGIAVLDAQGTILAWNPAAARLFQLDSSEAVGRELASLIFPEHLQSAVGAVLSRQITEPDSGLAQRQLELAARRGDGRE